jgi:hypothetical protein
MRAFQLTDMLVTLRGVLEEHPQGLTLDAEMVGALVAGLHDMVQAAETLQQAAIELAELRRANEPAVPPPATVIPFPIVARPIPAQGGVA